MKVIAQILLSVLLFVAAGSLHAQKVNSYKNKHKPIRVSSQKAKVICPIFEESAYPYHGFGVKFGDPVAFTYKLYLVKKISFVIDVGSASSALYNNRHREDFTNYYDEIGQPNILNQSNDLLIPNYLKHHVNSEYIAEGKVLYQIQADNFYKGLQAYVGLGWQYRKLGITYDYYFTSPSSSEQETGEFTKERYYQGPEIIGGLEYSYFKIPVAAFMEVTMFRNIVNQPGWSRFQGGVGLRYIF